MSDIFSLLLIAGVYILIQKVLFPRLGIPT